MKTAKQSFESNSNIHEKSGYKKTARIDTQSEIIIISFCMHKTMLRSFCSPAFPLLQPYTITKSNTVINYSICFQIIVWQKCCRNDLIIFVWHMKLVVSTRLHTVPVKPFLLPRVKSEMPPPGMHKKGWKFFQITPIFNYISYEEKCKKKLSPPKSQTWSSCLICFILWSPPLLHIPRHTF